MAKMNKKEKDDFLRVIDRIRGNMSDAHKLRKDIFFGKPKSIEKVRIWFDHMPSYQLPKEEREEILKSYKTWEVFKTLITQQKDMDSTEIMEFYNAIGKTSQSHLWFTILQSNKAYDEDRIDILESIINYNNQNYHRILLEVLDRELSSFEADDFWKEALTRVVEYINENGKNATSLVDQWVAEGHLLYYIVDELQLTSAALYDATGNESFLPTEAKDIFLF